MNQDIAELSDTLVVVGIEVSGLPDFGNGRMWQGAFGGGALLVMVDEDHRGQSWTISVRSEPIGLLKRPGERTLTLAYGQPTLEKATQEAESFIVWLQSLFGQAPT